MTENKEAKEHTIHKLTNFSWQRKLHERNSAPKNVDSERDQFFDSVAKPNSESRLNHVMKQDLQIHQTHVFKTKNDVTTAYQQNRDNKDYVKMQEGENNNQKTFATNRETLNNQRYERQPKTRNDYHGQNYRRDEKENVNFQKYTSHRSNSGNQNLQHQKYYKQDNHNFRCNVNNESSNQNVNNNENYVKKDQRNFINQSRNFNQNNRGYDRSQEKSNHQNNYHQNDDKHRNNYQNSAPFKKNTRDSFPQSNYSKLGTSPKNSAPVIHFQRNFCKGVNKNCYTNVTNNQGTNSAVGKNCIPETEQFAQLDLSENDVGNVHSNDNHRTVLNQFLNFTNGENFSNDLLSDQFTAGISEPIVTNIYQNDTFRNNLQLNQQSNISVTSINSADNYASSCQPLIRDDFNNSSYSNQITGTNTLARSNQCQFVDQFIPNNIPAALSSLSPEVADFVPRKNQFQNVDQLEFSNPLVSHRQEQAVENSCVFSFSTPNSNQSLNSSWLSSKDVSNCNESMNLENNSFQNYINTPATFNQRNSNEGPNDIFNRRTPVPDTSTECQTFNFNGRIVNLSDKRNQIDTNQHPPSYDSVPNFNSYQDDLIDDQLNYSNSMHSGINNDYSGSLGFSNQQMSNILKMASLNLDQQTSPVSLSDSQHINDMLHMSNLNVNLNQNVRGHKNVSDLSPSVVHSSSNGLLCDVMQNSRVNTIQDCYTKPIADVANNLKCNESEEMNSQFAIVAQQLLNVNKYVTSAEMNTGTVTVKDSVCGTNAGKFNMSTFTRCKNEVEKYRHMNSLLSSNNSQNQYDNIFTPTDVESPKSYRAFPSQTIVNSNFIPNETQQFDIRSKYNDAIRNNNPMLPTEFLTNMQTSGAETKNDFQSNYGRNNAPMNNNNRYRYANATVETNTSPKNRQNSFKNEFNRSNNNRRMFDNQVRIINNEPANSMTINIRDDCFINFNRKARSEDHGSLKFPITIAEAPSVGILKKPPKRDPVSDSSINFQKYLDRSNDNMYVPSKGTPTFSKRVSFSLENELQEIV